MAFKRYFKIWKINLHAALMTRLAYRFSFVFICVTVILEIAFTLMFVKIIFNFINNLSGWTFDQALLVVASYMLVEGLLWAGSAALSGISYNVRMGTMDYILVKPVDSLFLVSIWRGDIEDWVRVFSALVVLFYAICHLGLPAKMILVNFGYYLVMIFSALIIIYSINLIIKTLSFWIVDIRGVWNIANTITKTSQYPTDIFFHKTIRVVFSTIIPLAFVATVPAKILIYGFNPILFFSSCFLATIFFVLARKFWLFGLKHYSSASS